MLNRVILIGRLTRAPELKYSAGATAIATFTLAVDRNFQKAGAEKETDFIRIICFGKTAEHCNKFLAKGRLVAVDGRLQIRKWEDKGGERRTMAEVVAENVHFLERAPKIEDDGFGAADAGAPHEEQPPKDFGKITDKDLDEEIDLNEDPF